jgi:RimJ/RimL family protein N-acetyltransferase
MKYIRYGVSLSLIRESDLETVRQWRNDPVVVRNYAFREYITPEMQQQWFRSINNIHNLYAIIGYQGERVGVINLKNIDWDQKTYEGGIFIPYERYHNTPLPAIVACFTTEIPFTWFDWNTGFAHVLASNKSTQAFVKQLGYLLAPGQEDVENQEYLITRESFEKYALRFRKAIQALTGDYQPGRLVIEPHDYEDPVPLHCEKMGKLSKALLKSESGEEGRIYFFK